MKLSVRSRALVVVVASASLLAVPLALPTAAATGASCKKVSQTTVGSSITFSVSQCTPLAATGGSGKGPVTGTKTGQTKGTLNVKITWVQNKGTTSAKIGFAPDKSGIGKCPAGSSRIKITGSVTAGTGTAVKTITKGQAVTGSVCLKTVGTTTTLQIEPGTVVKF